MIENIPTRKIITVSRELPTEGNHPLLTLCDDYGIYYVKNSKFKNPAYEMINEFICHFMLKQWDINTPEIAFINSNKLNLNAAYEKNHNSKYYSERLAIGSKAVPTAIDATLFLSQKSKINFKKYHSQIDFHHIGLFDLWIENDDRGPELKNLMVYEENKLIKYLAIDHAFVLRTGAYKTLTEKTFASTKNNSILESDFKRTQNKFLIANPKLIESEREYFYLSISKCQKILPEIFNLIPDNWGLSQNDKDLISNFLFEDKRNHAIFEEYKRLF